MAEGGREGVMWFTGRAKAILREQARLIPSEIGHGFHSDISQVVSLKPPRGGTGRGGPEGGRLSGQEGGRAGEREGEEGLT